MGDSFLNKYTKHIIWLIIISSFLIGIFFRKNYPWGHLIILSMSIPLIITYFAINKLYSKLFVSMLWGLMLPVFAIQLYNDAFDIKENFYLFIFIVLLMVIITVFFTFKTIKKNKSKEERNQAIRVLLRDIGFTLFCYITVYLLSLYIEYIRPF